MVDLVYDRRGSGKIAEIITSLLFLLSHLFHILCGFAGIYTKIESRNTPLGCLVVVVGNLTVGGTGKTPVGKVCTHFEDRGRKVAILSRGYKSKRLCLENFGGNCRMETSHLQRS